MKIGLNLLYMIPEQVGGTQTYAIALLHALAGIDRSNEYYVFLNKEGASLDLQLGGNFHIVKCKFEGHSRFARYVWEQLALPIQLINLKIDVVHSLGYVGPLLSPCPSIVTIPDINFIVLKNDMSILKRSVLRFFSTQSAIRASHVITISNFSKAELARHLKLDWLKICVTHLGSKEEMPENCAMGWNVLKKTYSIREPYIVAFGGGALHKNIMRLIQAYCLLINEFPHQLVLMGHIPSNVDLKRIMNTWHLDGRLITTGYIPDKNMLPLLSHAELFVLPSLYEGFGLPVLEAQEAGVPVVCSSAASLPEVGGEGALYIDPTSSNDMANGIRRCLKNTDMRLSLIAKGKENLKRFSWKKTAVQTLEVYRRVYEAAYQ